MAENCPYQKLEVIKSIKFLQNYHEKREAVGALLSHLFFTHSRESKQKNLFQVLENFKTHKKTRFFTYKPLGVYFTKTFDAFCDTNNYSTVIFLNKT